MEYSLCKPNRYLHQNRKERNKDLIIKVITMVDTITVWFETTEYDNKHEITIAYLVQITCLTRFPWPKTLLMIKNHNLLVMSL